MSGFSEFKPSKNFSFRLSREKLNEIKRVFDVYDDDYDGFLNVCHLGSLMRVVGLFPSEKDMISIVKNIDPENTGTVSLGQVFILVANSFRDIGEIEQSTKNSIKKISYEPDAKHSKKKDKASKQVVFEDEAKKEEKKKVINVQTLQNSILDRAGEPLNDEECDEFMSSIPKSFVGRLGDLDYDKLENFIINDQPAWESVAARKVQI